jgi:hypothetical protein
MTDWKPGSHVRLATVRGQEHERELTPPLFYAIYEKSTWRVFQGLRE